MDKYEFRDHRFRYTFIHFQAVNGKYSIDDSDTDDD